jgi:PAS domain S-box-containing protein
MDNNMVLRPDDLTTDDKEQILEAIRTGRVDAFVVEEREGHAVYALQNADLPYSTLVQRMQQGAAMLNARGEMIYCNPSLSAHLGQIAHTLIGSPLQELVEPGDRDAFQKLFQDAQEGSSEGELRLLHSDAGVIPARFSFTALSADKSVIGVLITDLTTEKSNADLASRIQRVQDDERRGLARELHDSVGQLLAALTMNLASLRQGVSGLTPPQLALLEDSTLMVTQVSKEIRTISHLLHPPLLDIAGISSAIRWYVDGFSERSRIKVYLDLPSDLGRLSTDVETALFRVVQECLTNVYRHSGSSSCSVTLTRHASGLQLTIRDFGHGMPQPVKGKISSGVGLRGMQERLLLLGGTLDIASNTSGTTVTASLPVTDGAAEPDLQAV